MKEDKLGKLSMELSVEVLNLVKELREKRKISYQTKSEEVLQAYALILRKVNMVTVERTSLQNWKLH